MAEGRVMVVEVTVMAVVARVVDERLGKIVRWERLVAAPAVAMVRPVS